MTWRKSSSDNTTSTLSDVANARVRCVIRGRKMIAIAKATLACPSQGFIFDKLPYRTNTEVKRKETITKRMALPKAK